MSRKSRPQIDLDISTAAGSTCDAPAAPSGHGGAIGTAAGRDRGLNREAPPASAAFQRPPGAEPARSAAPRDPHRDIQALREEVRVAL